MLKKIPIVSCPISVGDLLSGGISSFSNVSEVELGSALSKLLGLEHIFFANSATSSFYTILNTFKQNSDKKEVILPAYTASTLVIAIRKAGLTPVLCDISLDDFNMDLSLLSALVSERTLAILGVHMFGIVSKGMREIRDKGQDFFVLEDCAQGMGSKINGAQVGNLGDVSFFSFNRGKNLPTYGGGCIATNSKELSEKIAAQGQGIKRVGISEGVNIALKLMALSVVMRPWVYGALFPLIARCKEKPPPDDFEVKRYTYFQAGVAASLLKKMEKLSNIRYNNGMRLIEGVKDVDGIILPEIAEGTKPAFNRLPVVFKDLGKRDKVEESLRQKGIETSRMYYKPLHHLFDLGYKKEGFPKATYFAEHLLTLPTHPLLSAGDVGKIIDVIREC